MCAMKAKHDLPQLGLFVEDQLTSLDGCALYLPEETTSIAELESLNERLLRNIKSESQMEMESRARQKEIDRKLLLAEKVSKITWTLSVKNTVV